MMMSTLRDTSYLFRLVSTASQKQLGWSSGSKKSSWLLENCNMPDHSDDKRDVSEDRGITTLEGNPEISDEFFGKEQMMKSFSELISLDDDEEGQEALRQENNRDVFMSSLRDLLNGEEFMEGSDFTEILSEMKEALHSSFQVVDDAEKIDFESSFSNLMESFSDIVQSKRAFSSWEVRKIKKEVDQLAKLRKKMKATEKYGTNFSSHVKVPRSSKKTKSGDTKKKKNEDIANDSSLEGRLGGLDCIKQKKGMDSVSKSGRQRGRDEADRQEPRSHSAPRRPIRSKSRDRSQHSKAIDSESISTTVKNRRSKSIGDADDAARRKSRSRSRPRSAGPQSPRTPRTPKTPKSARSSKKKVSGVLAQDAVPFCNLDSEHHVSPRSTKQRRRGASLGATVERQRRSASGEAANIAGAPEEVTEEKKKKKVKKKLKVKRRGASVGPSRSSGTDDPPGPDVSGDKKVTRKKVSKDKLMMKRVRGRSLGPSNRSSGEEMKDKSTSNRIRIKLSDIFGEDGKRFALGEVATLPGKFNSDASSVGSDMTPKRPSRRRSNFGDTSTNSDASPIPPRRRRSSFGSTSSDTTPKHPSRKSSIIGESGGDVRSRVRSLVEKSVRNSPQKRAEAAGDTAPRDETAGGLVSPRRKKKPPAGIDNESERSLARSIMALVSPSPRRRKKQPDESEKALLAEKLAAPMM